MTLHGPDISHHQNDAGFNIGTVMNNSDFVVVKATQGTGYVDPKFAANIGALRAARKLRAIYHFAGNLLSDGKTHPADPVAEANFFVAKAQPQPGEVLVLDWEPTAPPADPDSWCATFLARVKALTGRVPMVYMSSSVAAGSRWTKTRALNPGLWVARYGVNNGQKPAITLNVGSWGGYAMWQYTSNGRLPGASGVLDLNEFYGDAAAWLSYGGQGTAPTKEDDLPSADDLFNADLFTDDPDGPGRRVIRLRDALDEMRRAAQTINAGFLDELRPLLVETVNAALAENNARSADEIVDEFIGRLAEQRKAETPA